MAESSSSSQSSSSRTPAASSPAPTSDDPASTVSRINARIIGICVAAALGGFLFGFDTAVINGAVDALSDQFALSDALKGFSVSSALIGCTLGAWFAGPVSNRLGRVPVMLIAAVMFLASALGSGLAFGVIDFIVWRVVGGLGVGRPPSSPRHTSPRSPRRVCAVAWAPSSSWPSSSASSPPCWPTPGLRTAGGAAKELWLGMEAWRWMFIAEALPALVYGLFAFRLPESPRFLVARGNYDKASQVLYDFTGIVNVNLKIEEIRSTIDSEKRESLSDLRGSALGLKPIVWVGILLSVFQQFVGINVIFYYSTTLWRTVGFEESDALTITVITSVTNILVTILAILLVDKVGRRPMLLAGSFFMTVSLGLMALAFSFANVSGGEVTLEAPWSPIALVAANLFVVAFGATWGPLMWVLLGEMFPNRIRAGALAVAAAAQWVANFFISTTFPSFSSISLTFAYGFYAFFALLSLIFVFFRVPETKGKELEEMEDLAVWPDS